MPAEPIDTYTTPKGVLIERWDNNDPKRPERITVKRPPTPGAPPILARMFTYRTTAEADAAWSALVPTVRRTAKRGTR